MQDFGEAFRLAFGLVLTADPDLLEIIGLSLRVSLSAVAIACALGLPLGGSPHEPRRKSCHRASASSRLIP